jgi:L-alanine-DL-glutamate epimerase-like enolase superfamily enzyme
VVLCASTHLALNAPNALIQESVRAYHRTWYRDLVDRVPEIDDGYITVPDGPGLGMELSEDIDDRFTITRRTTSVVGT